jgi:sporulation protein YlmC with PRC-barrel domain
MKRSTVAASIAACMFIGYAARLLAADPTATGTVNQSPADKAPAADKASVAKCLSDLRALDGQMEKEGYWLGASGYAYGYPTGEIGYGGFHHSRRNSVANVTGYPNARPGYEIRSLVVAANILARHGNAPPCEEVLDTARDIYNQYSADMHTRGMPMVDMPGWRQEQIAAAQSVADKTTSFRSDELLGTDVRTPHNEALGSVDDLVMNPRTGKIAYLVIARGGIFGIDEKYVPVPWDNFKVSPNVNLLVLDTTKGTMSAAPQVDHDGFAKTGDFDLESRKIDVYWKAHLSDKGAD